MLVRRGTSVIVGTRRPLRLRRMFAVHASAGCVRAHARRVALEAGGPARSGRGLLTGTAQPINCTLPEAGAACGRHRVQETIWRRGGEGLTAFVCWEATLS